MDKSCPGFPDKRKGFRIKGEEIWYEKVFGVYYSSDFDIGDALRMRSFG